MCIVVVAYLHTHIQIVAHKKRKKAALPSWSDNTRAFTIGR